MKTFRLRVCLVVLLAAAAVLGLRYFGSAATLTRTEVRMNTPMTVTLVGERNKAEKALSGVFDLLAFLNEEFSRYRHESAVSRLGAMAGKEPVVVGADLYLLLQESLRLAESTGGCFDPTIGPLTDLWRIMSKNGYALPAREEIETARARVDYRELELISPDRAFLRFQGAKIDLGAIAKGYAADRVAEYCRMEGIRSGLFDLGGNLLVMGRRSDGKPWLLGIRHPLKERNAVFCTIVCDVKEADTLSVVTSGSYERYREVDGKRLSHIFDPRTGFPVETPLLSVSVIASKSVIADALATAFLVMGEEKARPVLDKFPGTEAVFILSGEGGELEVHATKGLRGLLEAADEVTQIDFR